MCSRTLNPFVMRLAIPLALPFLIMLVYIGLTRYLEPVNGWAPYDRFTYGFAVGVGVTSFLHLKMSWLARIIGTIAYAVVIPYLLFFWIFAVHFAITGDSI